LSRKTGAKKGGMRGGANRLDRSRPFKIEISAIDENKNGIVGSINTMIFILNFESLIGDRKYNRGNIVFKFKSDVSDQKIIDILKNKENKVIAYNYIKDDFRIEVELNIVISIPYIAEDGSEKIKKYIWFNYNPTKPTMMSNNDTSDLLGINSLRLNTS